MLYGVDDGLAPGFVNSLVEDSDGTIWAGGLRGLSRYRDGRWETVAPQDGRSAAAHYATFEDPSGRLMIATSAGVFWRSDDRERVFRPGRQEFAALFGAETIDELERVVGPVGNAGFTVLSDRRHNLWLGFTDGNVGVVRPDGHLQLYTETGVDGAITALYQDEPDTVWLAANDGVSRVRNGRFVTVNRRRNGLPGDAASAIVQDDEGALWVGLNAGIARIRQEEFDRVARRPDHQIDYRLYDSTDGLVGMPVRRGMPSAVRGADGRVWFVTGGAAAVFDPAGMQRPPVPPTVRVEGLTAGRRRFEPTGDLRLPAGSSELSIDYTALTFTSPAKVRFRYRLEGFDSDWVDAGSRRQAFYTNLPPRAYRFEVTAATKEGGWGREGAVLAFSIAPSFYQTGWFYALTVAGLGLAVWGISEETVQVHLRNIFAKLEVNDRTAALTVALRRGFIHLPE